MGVWALIAHSGLHNERRGANHSLIFKYRSTGTNHSPMFRYERRGANHSPMFRYGRRGDAFFRLTDRGRLRPTPVKSTSTNWAANQCVPITTHKSYLCTKCIGACKHRIELRNIGYGIAMKYPQVQCRFSLWPCNKECYLDGDEPVVCKR